MRRATNDRAERQVILLSSATAERRSAMAAEAGRLMADVSWTRLTETLHRRRLLPNLGPRVLELADGHAGESFASAVSKAIDGERSRGAFMQLVSLQLMAALNDAGIPSAALKGPLLGEAIYGDPGRRPSSDIDLLVSPEHLGAAVEVARRLGYEAPRDSVRGGGLPLLHFTLVHAQGALPPLELHWRIHWYESRFACERLLPAADERAGHWRPAPAEELAALLLFYARDGFVDLRLATDLSAWWDTLGATLTTGALEELIDAYPELARPLRVAVAVADRVVGVPSRQLLGMTRRSGLRERVAMRLANPNPRRTSAPQLNADMGLIDGLLAPPGGFRAFVGRQVLPPHEVLVERARQAHDRRGVSRVGHGARVLVRYALASARLLRAPEILQVI